MRGEAPPARTNLARIPVSGGPPETISDGPSPRSVITPSALDNTSTFLRQNPAGQTLFLLERARSGSETAWREIYRRYRTMLVVQIRSRIPDFARRRFDAEDLLQSAFSKAWVHIGTFQYQGEGSFRRWLAVLVFREFQDELRAQQGERARLSPGGQDEDDEGLSVPDESCLQPTQLLSKMALLEQLGRLDEEDRDVLCMRVFEEKTWEEIGEVLGCSKGYARVQYDRAVGRLQRLLG